MDDLYLQLAELGVDVKTLKEMNPTGSQLAGLRDGLLKIIEEQEAQ